MSKLEDYMAMLRQPFIKLCRLRFLQPDGSTAFAVDNRAKGKAFLADEGSLVVNLQNGQRRTASVTLSNVDSEYDYNINNLWFGREVALDMGLVLSDGSDYYRPMGVFLLDTPTENVQPEGRTISYNLVDKWANLDGTMYGNLEGTYEVPVNTNIFTPIATLLSEDKGNGLPVDRVPPIFTEYYNNKTQTLPNGSSVSMVLSPYTMSVDTTIADVILELGGMVNALIGYDNTGALRLDPSQDDISDASKPVLWTFSQNEAELLGLTYQINNTEVYNDYIVIGDMLDDYTQPAGRAQNLDPASDTAVGVIGRKTIRENKSGFGTSTQCRDYADWKLKRSTVLQKAVSVSCSQMFHLQENSLIEIVRNDKGGAIERHLIQGFTIPIANEPMTISAISVNDYPNTTLQTWPV